MQAKMQSILDDYQADLERASEMASLRFNALVESTLDGWAERYARHTFEVEESHGMMSISIYPALKMDGATLQRHSPLQLLNPKNWRGAVAELIEEARFLVDCYDESERRHGLNCAEYKTKGKA